MSTRRMWKMSSEVRKQSGGERLGRASRPMLFMGIAKLYGQRSSCPRSDVGAVAIRDGRVIAAGYCGAPSGMSQCDEQGCVMSGGSDPGCIRSVHAEANLIAWAARTGTALKGSTIYTTLSPCRNCAMLILNAGIKEVSYEVLYRDPSGRDLLIDARVHTVRHEPE